MISPLEIGVTTWSFHIPEIRFEEILRTVKEDVQLNVIQVGAFGKVELTKKIQDQWQEAIQRSGLEVAATCVAFLGEDYSSIDAAIATCGFIDPKDFDIRFKHISNMAKLSEALGVHKLTTHLGYIPHDRNHPKYAYMLDVTRRIADALGERGITLGLEVGGLETAEDLLGFIDRAGRNNIRINYDPANLVRTNISDPVEPLEVLQEYVFLVHLKDAVLPEKPGMFGNMAALGDGVIDARRFVDKLKGIGYQGPLIIEGEGGYDTIGHVRSAKDLLHNLI